MQRREQSVSRCIRSAGSAGPTAESLPARSPLSTTDLRTSTLVGPVGLEPTTRGLKVRCSANRARGPDARGAWPAPTTVFQTEQPISRSTGAATSSAHLLLRRKHRDVSQAALDPPGELVVVCRRVDVDPQP